MAKKLNKDIALARIKLKINQYFQDVGRGMFEDTDAVRIELIDDIDSILDDAEISSKDLILEKFKMESKPKDEF